MGQRFHSFVITSMGKIHYRRIGAGKSDLLIVMLAGIGMDSSYWPEVLEDLGSTHDVLAIDLLGRGGTDAGQGPYNQGTYTDQVCESLRALELDGRPLLICGLSFGAGVAMQVAASAKEKKLNVIGTMLLTPAGLALDPSAESSLKLLRAMPRGCADVLGVLAQISSLLCMGNTGQSEAAVEPGYSDRARRVWVYSWQTYILQPSFFRAYTGTLCDFPLGAAGANLHAALNDLSPLGSRVQVVLAEEDTVVPTETVNALLCAKLPEADVIRIAGGHNIAWDQPVLTGTLVRKFAESLESRSVSKDLSGPNSSLGSKAMGA